MDDIKMKVPISELIELGHWDDYCRRHCIQPESVDQNGEVSIDTEEAIDYGYVDKDWK